MGTARVPIGIVGCGNISDIYFTNLTGVFKEHLQVVAKGGKPIFEGLRFGMIIGILWVFPHELAMTGAHDGKSVIYVIKNAGWHIIEQGIGGIIMGLIYGRLNK